MKHLALIALGGSLACTAVESDRVATAGIHAQITARAYGDGTTHLAATLFVGHPAYLHFVELGGDDQLIVAHGSDRQVMSVVSSFHGTKLHAELPTDREGATFVVELARRVDAGARRSSVSLPAPFAITPIAEASRAAALELRWSPAGTPDEMRWEAAGDCIASTSGTLRVDTGAATIGPLHERWGLDVPDTCAVTVTLVRARHGELDPGYGAGGRIVGEQVRTLTFLSRP